MERERFGELAVTPEARRCAASFWADGVQAQRVRGQGGGAFPKVQTVGILGAGLMGAGIAEVTASKAMRVLLKDRDGPRSRAAPR